MKDLCRTLSLGLTALMGVLDASCASAGHPAAVSPTYLAQSAVTDCRPGDSSMVCCIKKFPLAAMESCGATAAEVAGVLNGIKILSEAAHSESGQPVETAKESAKDDTDEGWREHCRETYVLCRDQKKPRWVGDCYACFRYCEGQRQWPFDGCHPTKR
jgi:hypothetical protein